jgi:hypothetical protein
MTDRDLMHQALEALELLARYEHPLTKIQVRKPRDGGSIVTVYPHQVATDAAELLRERLAQPERTWVKLTAEEKAEIWSLHETAMVVTATEAKLKEKNT